jgi:dTDP-4-amino-4,6-dideoxygalactose transaminase
MRKSFIPFAKPVIGEEEIEAVTETLRSGWLTTGPKTRQFEHEFSEFIGGGVDAIAVNSATAGLHLALEALGVGAGDEVIVPTHTFTATAEVVRYLGADPVFVDICPISRCLDPDKFEQAITPKTKVVMPVHYAGIAADMPRILEIARRHNIAVVEDAAHALPTTIDGKIIGSLESDVTVFSFYANKTITTGEGGMLVTKRSELAARARVMRLHGISTDAFDRFTAEKPSWFYEVVAPGFKYNLTDLASAIGLCQLKKAHAFQKARAEIAEQYLSAFTDLPLILPSRGQQGDVHSWHLFVVQMDEGCALTRDAFVRHLYEDAIGCSVHYIPLHQQPYWVDRYNLKAEDFPFSEALYQRCLSLPIYASMTAEEVDRVIASVRASFK